MISGLLLTLTLATAVSGDGEAERVFFALLAGGDATTDQEVSLLQDAVLVAARKHAGTMEVLAVSDVRDLLEADAQAQVSGCDSVSCASEIADALNAPQLVTGQVGRVGDTWLLTLTRTDRDTLEVLAREQVQRRGAAADVLLPAIDATVARLFGATPTPTTSPLVWVGGATLGASLLAAAVGGVANGLSFSAHQDAQGATTNAGFQQSKEAGETYVVVAWIGYVAGGALLAVGGGVLAAGLLGIGGE